MTHLKKKKNEIYVFKVTPSGLCKYGCRFVLFCKNNNFKDLKVCVGIYVLYNIIIYNIAVQ